MSAFLIISIVFFSLSGVLFVAAIVVFFSTDVISSIKFLTNKDKSHISETVTPAASIPVQRSSMVNTETKAASVTEAPSVQIEYVKQTVDEDDLNEHQNSAFQTMDWYLPEGVSFVLTTNILVYFSDKEYLVSET